MGTVTQFIAFLNAEKLPTIDQQFVQYTHLTITNDLKKLRREYRMRNRRAERCNY